MSVCLTSVCLSVAYIGPRKTKTGTEIAHITRDLDSTFKDKMSRPQGRGHIVAAWYTACLISLDTDVVLEVLPFSHSILTPIKNASHEKQ